MRKPGKYTPKHLGEMRTSQLITSYGVGAMVDFKDETAILAEADAWNRPPDNDKRKIHCHNLEKVLGKEFFVRPKWDPNRHPVYSDRRPQNIGAFRFPGTLYCPRCERLDFNEPSAAKGPVKCRHCPSRLVPSRFVVVCAHGHLDDFPYDAWVHEGKPCPSPDREEQPNLKLTNIDGRNSINSLQVICEDCKAKKSMQGALAPGGLKAIHYKCKGRRPWLSVEFDPVPCTEEASVRLRTAAGVYMPVNISALDIPPWSAKVMEILQQHQKALKNSSDEFILQYIRNLCLDSLTGMKAEDMLAVWRYSEKIDQTNRPQNEQELYEDEYLALCHEAVNSWDDFDFDSMEQNKFSSVEKSVPEKYGKLIHRVFAVDRLTEVVAMLGFTRLRSWDGDFGSEVLAPIFSKRNLPWLPAVELYGEGIFIELDEDSVREWEAKNEGVYNQMIRNAAANRFRCENLSPRYVLLHTLSHLLIRALAVNCGYQASSMKERVYSTYADGQPMAGLLIYTTAADTEGSLGGLVGQAEHLEEHLDALLNEAEWCSSDPLCLMSSGKNAQGLFGLNYAACPQCALLPETSCSMRNSLLDRAALIGRTQDSTIGYFAGIL